MKQLKASMVLEPQPDSARSSRATIGKVEVKLGEEVVHSADPRSPLEPVEEGGFFRRLWDSIRLFFYACSTESRLAALNTAGQAPR